MACQGFLVREACVGVLVGGAGFLLSVGLAEVFAAMQCSSFPKGVDPKSDGPIRSTVEINAYMCL